MEQLSIYCWIYVHVTNIIAIYGSPPSFPLQAGWPSVLTLPVPISLKSYTLPSLRVRGRMGISYPSLKKLRPSDPRPLPWSQGEGDEGRGQEEVEGWQEEGWGEGHRWCLEEGCMDWEERSNGFVDHICMYYSLTKSWVNEDTLRRQRDMRRQEPSCPPIPNQSILVSRHGRPDPLGLGLATWDYINVMPDMKFWVTFMTCAEVEQSEKLPEPTSQLVPWLMLLHNRHGRVPLVMHYEVSKCSTSSIQKA